MASIQDKSKLTQAIVSVDDTKFTKDSIIASGLVLFANSTIILDKITKGVIAESVIPAKLMESIGKLVSAVNEIQVLDTDKTMAHIHTMLNYRIMIASGEPAVLLSNYDRFYAAVNNGGTEDTYINADTMLEALQFERQLRDIINLGTITLGMEECTGCNSGTNTTY